MNFFRLSGSAVLETCSAETTVPWMTRMSRPASRMVLAIQSVRCGGDRRGGHDARVLHLLDALGDQLELDRLEVHLLHPRGGLVVVEFADLVEEGHRVLVAGPEALEVQARRARRDDRVRSRSSAISRRPWPNRAPAARTCTRRSARRCRRPRGRGSAVRGRWRCRRSRRPVAPTCRCRSPLPP